MSGEIKESKKKCPICGDMVLYDDDAAWCFWGCFIHPRNGEFTVKNPNPKHLVVR